MNLHRSITRSALRKLLSEEYPELFCITTLQKSLSTKHNSKMNMSDVFYKLATLNGFTKLSKIQCPVPLAEGVVAVQRGQLMNRYTVYARTTNIIRTNNPEIRTPGGDTFNTRFPPFREEDFTLYRKLESRLDAYLSKKKEAWIDYFSDNPVVTMLHKAVLQIIPSKLQIEDDSFNNEHKGQLCTESNNFEKSSQQCEDLLVIQQGKLCLLQQIEPEYRLLALPPLILKTPQLPYKLKHNMASSIIYVSLIGFGALPLAYRTIKYALDYPGLVKALLASFCGSMAYSILYSRYGTRVRQQLCVERAVGSRILARDSAVLTLLVEGAVTNILQMICDESKPEEHEAMRDVLREINLDPAKVIRQIESPMIEQKS